jgi:lipopolysaccharide/colanic/teichoic acid biosynthesis glycosyltransferase
MTEKASLKGDTGLRRATDLLVGGPVLLLLSPFLLGVAILIKLGSRGPVLFSQERVGRGLKPFRILKFRSMVADAQRLGPPVSGRGDVRITRLGHWLRATKLDELPQLLNLLKGEVTLVGPRAEVESYVAHYTDEERALLSVRPGLTGPGQLYFTTHQAAELDRTDDPEAFYLEHQLHPKLAMDLEYLRQRSLGRDLAVLARTTAVVLGWRGGAPRRAMVL